jgi:[acyl-carrier-protein] S-malonyltransferase
MTQTALFFPGQASQYVGMGQDLFDNSEAVRKLYQLASDEIGEDIAVISFEGPAEELKRTRFTQPAILLHSLAVLTIMKDEMPAFDYAAGHSLGEYGALVACGALSAEDAVRAVVRRAALMEEACQANPGTMAAIIGLNEEQVNEVCEHAAASGVVIPANYNSKIQIAISGSMAGIEAALPLAREKGAKRAMTLEVGGAFHSPLMASATAPLKEFLDGITINDPAKPIVANVTADVATSGAQIRDLLVAQVTAPVKWAQTMAFLAANDVDEVIEIGPGKVLSGLAKRDMSCQSMISLDTLADLENFRAISAAK